MGVICVIFLKPLPLSLMVQRCFSPETTHFLYDSDTFLTISWHSKLIIFYSTHSSFTNVKTSKSKYLCENDDTMSDVTVFRRRTFPYTSPPVTQTAGEIKAHECCRIICPSLILITETSTSFICSRQTSSLSSPEE